MAEQQPKTDLVITQKDASGKKVNTTLAYVNYNASKEQLRELAVRFSALSTNLFQSATRTTEEAL